ncbi:pH-sensitive adenylate cyclase [Paraconexibacter sp. AEG42_29]|uniref:PH-sensitive adenylate cyclase n=1 Tax=Paraconexibacter sp. AEG42_29 TaxID=2997339 RepID=A0AAU7ATW3_9ACTN
MSGPWSTAGAPAAAAATDSGRPHVFVIADLVGFTMLTERHGDEYAADIAQAFCAQVGRLLPPGAEDFKMLGDACLLRFDDAGQAVTFARRLVRELADPRSVSIGMHRGPAVQRGSDWFGAAVNVTARVAALAAPGEILVTGAIPAALAPAGDVAFADRGVTPLQGVSTPPRLYAVSSP